MSSTNSHQDAEDSADDLVEEIITTSQESKMRRDANQKAFFNHLAFQAEQNQLSDLPSDQSGAYVAQPSGKIIDQVRDYQQELFERAIEENVIAVLDTGCGKTLIAVLLIRHVLTQELIKSAESKDSRIVFFLVNSVHLVRQQARVLENNLSTKPAALHGDAEIDSWKEDDWKKVFSATSVVVCTAALLDQCLMHSFITMDQISLLVFDEAHHCKKNHPYSRIIRDYYLNFDGTKPRIFGMTASPVDSKKNMPEAAADLEELLDSKIVTTRTGSLFEFSNKPIEVSWPYESSRTVLQTKLYQDIYDLCGFIDAFKKFFSLATIATCELGPWCADRLWAHAIGGTNTPSTTLMNRIERGKQYISLDIAKRQKLLTNVHLAVQSVQRSQVKSIQLHEMHFSPKVIVLMKGIEFIYKSQPNTRAIVFVERRLTAKVLNEAIALLELPHIRSGALIGVGYGQLDSDSSKEQEKVLEDFRNGYLNLMFATSIAEEGIDIPQCDLVVRFDLYKTAIQYMQSRGRARKKESLYVHMIEKDNLDHVTGMQHAMAMDKYIKEFCNSLPVDRMLGKGTKLRQMIARDRANRSFKTSSGTICNFGNCLVILSRYVSSLGRVEERVREIFEEEITDDPDATFRYTVRLPTDDRSNIWGALGEPRQSKTLAKRSAAFNCVQQLRAAGLLNDNLDSILGRLKPTNLNALLAVTEKKSEYCMITKPRSFWLQDIETVPHHLFASIIRIRSEVPLRQTPAEMVLLTRQPLPQIPDFPLFLEENVEAEVSFDITANPLPVNEQDLKLITAYTLNAVFADVFNKVYEADVTKVGYWLVPMAQTGTNTSTTISSLLNISMLRLAANERVRWKSGMSQQDWVNKFLVDPFSGRYRYSSGNVVLGRNIHDPVSETLSSSIGKGKRDSIIDFTDSRWKASKRKNIMAHYDSDQPVLMANIHMTRRNFLARGTEKENRHFRCEIAVQPLEIGRISLDAAHAVLAWPSILHRLESYMIVQEAFDRLDLSEIPLDLALQAFTKTSSAEDEGDQPHDESLQGIGKNYERLEFIGDTLLKMITTILVFNTTRYDEAGMHCQRMEMISNDNLFNVATGPLELYKYIRTSSFNRQTWYPENLVLLKGRGAKIPPEPVHHPDAIHHLSRKTIADVSEAIIGAAVMCTCDQLTTTKFDLGIKAISRLARGHAHSITSWRDLTATYNSPSWQQESNDPVAIDLATKVGTKIGYCFKYPRLVRSAFTHPSDQCSPVPDYQRLEFLGDGVLDWVCIWWLFSNHEAKNPQWLTEHKMAMVSNKFLSALAVLLEFDKFIVVTGPKHLEEIMTYANRVRSAYQALQTNDQQNHNRLDFWTRIDNPPKALADTVESIVGAILIDSGFNYSEIENFFNRHIKRFFEKINDYDDYANRHPTTYLISRLQNEFNCRNFNILSCRIPNSAPAVTSNNSHEIEYEEMNKTSNQLIRAGVVVHGTVIGTAKGDSEKYAKIRACKDALTLLESVQTVLEFKTRFGCDCTSKFQPELDTEAKVK